MNQHNFKVFEDDRMFQPWGLLHPKNATDDFRKSILEKYKPKKYQISPEIEIWFDGRFNRICTNIPGFFLQTISSSEFGEIQKRLFVSINGRRVQFSKENNASLESPVCVPPVKEDGKWAWKIEEIGAPLNFHTGFEDDRRGVRRPMEERRQCLTNASKFASRADQDRAISLVKAAFRIFGDIFGADATYGREAQNEHMAKFSDDLIKKINEGKYADL